MAHITKKKKKKERKYKSLIPEIKEKTSLQIPQPLSKR